MRTEQDIIKETRKASMICGAMADMLADEVNFDNLSTADEQKLRKLWKDCHSMTTDLMNAAYAMEERQ